jgi:hypothetical protein
MKTNPNDQRYHPVTLNDDPAFLGYIFAAYVDADGQLTGKLAVSVSKPGQSGYVGCVAIERERLVEC